MADQQDRVATLTGVPRFRVHLGDQGAGGVHHPQAAAFGLLADGGGHAVCRKHDGGAVRRFVEFLDEDRAATFEVGHDVRVVHDLPPDVDRAGHSLERLLDGRDRPLDTGAERPGLGEHDVARAQGAAPLLECRCEPGEDAQRGDAGGERTRRPKRGVDGVHDDPDCGERTVPVIGKQPEGLHVDRHRTGGAQPQPGPAVVDEAIVGEQRGRDGGQSLRADGGHQERRGGARHRAVRTADLGGDDHVTWLQVGGECSAHPGDRECLLLRRTGRG